jgi:hypothetical protein
MKRSSWRLGNSRSGDADHREGAEDFYARRNDGLFAVRRTASKLWRLVTDD